MESNEQANNRGKLIESKMTVMEGRGWRDPAEREKDSWTWTTVVIGGRVGIREKNGNRKNTIKKNFLLRFSFSHYLASELTVLH